MEKAKLVANWSKVQSLPKNYVHPPEARPGENVVGATCKNIPVIDLGHLDRPGIIRQIMEASQEFGFFQAINHGLAKELIEDAMNVFKEFHQLSEKEKLEEGSKDPNRSCKMYTSNENYESEKIHHWRDSLEHLCHPIDVYSPFWPEKPTRYCEVVGKYLGELRKLSMTMLEMFCEGLGLEAECLNGEVSENPIFRVHHYPPCPDPSLTLGLSKHRDPGLITILLQGDVSGFQVLKDERWISVDPIPYAFVVNIGYVLEVISNGKLMAVAHRAVTNSTKARTTAAYFVYPTNEFLVKPEEKLVDPTKPPLYRSFLYKDFVNIYRSGSNLVERAVQDIRVPS